MPSSSREGNRCVEEARAIVTIRSSLSSLSWSTLADRIHQKVTVGGYTSAHSTLTQTLQDQSTHSSRSTTATPPTVQSETQSKSS